MGGGSSRSLNVLVVGLDNSGKSTIISRMKATEAPQEIPPTPGYQVQNFKKDKINFTMFDMSGASKYRNLWEFYYKKCQAVIFVVDSADKIRMCVAKDELDAMLQSKDLQNVPLLLFANKMDIAGALNFSEVTEQLELHSIIDREWTIVPSNALTGEGIDDGVKWLEEKTKEKK